MADPRWMLWAVLLTSVAAQGPPPRSDAPAPAASPSRQKAQAPPRSEQESSSKDSITDLSPPPEDIERHPEDYPDWDSAPPTDVQEMSPYNPHRAAKDIEVGDYYFSRGNLKGAALRFRDALMYKPKDPEATFKLARTLEKMGEKPEAASLFRQYGRLAPGGPFAEAAAKGFERLRAFALADDPDSLMAEAEELLARKSFAEAAAKFRAVLALDPQKAEARFRLAQSLEGSGQLYDALQSYYDYLHEAAGGRHAEEAVRAMEDLKRRGVTLNPPSARTPR
jgi:tetratricopeptide (TPR) repeat protein